MSIGTVTTGAEGTEATVTNSGTSKDCVLNFTIPKGDKGDTGEKGDTGATGADGKAATITFDGSCNYVNVNDGAPSVTNSGTDTDAVLKFTLPYSLAGAIFIYTSLDWT